MAGDPVMLGAVELRRRLAARELGAVELLAAYRRRIERLDGELGAFVRLDESAEAAAREIDRRLDRGERLPLGGLPVALKDNLLTAGLATGCASRILDGFVPPVDATVVSRLREAGAVVLGKTNMDEFGMGSSTEHSVHGPTRNPHDPTRVAGGSSGGSAAAVAAHLAPLALGSDTGGSVRQPAAFCGVVGLKPTYGRVSRSGLVAFGSSLDQVGPLAGSVRDAALLLSVIAGPDERDATSAAEPVAPYLEACDGPVAGWRVGLPREYLGSGLDPAARQAVERAAVLLAAAGAQVRGVSLPHTRYAVATYYLVATAEASSNLARFDGLRYGWRAARSDTLQAMYSETRGGGFGREVRRRIMLGTHALSSGYHDRYYGRAQRVRTLVRGDFDAAFGDDGVDLLLTPATPTPPFALGEKQDDPLAMYLSDVYTVPASLAGLPALVVPAGRTSDGLPLGVQLIGPAFAEARLFAAGAAIEAGSAPADSDTDGGAQREPGRG